MTNLLRRLFALKFDTPGTWWSFQNRFRTLSFEQNYNQYFVNAFIINLNKYLHFRCERGKITTLLMFISTSKMLNHNSHPFFNEFDSYKMTHKNIEIDPFWLIEKACEPSKWIKIYSSVPFLRFFSTRLLFYLLIFWISFGPALKCMMNPSYPAPSSFVIYEACLHICLLIRYFTLTGFN